MHISLSLTVTERWSAARQMTSRDVPVQWLVLIGLALLLVLLAVVILLGLRRHQQNNRQQAEAFEAAARQRGLSVRECHILLAIARRSGLRRTHGIFQAADAFHRGASQLLAQYAQTRTPQENGQLKAEVLRLHQKLGFAAGPADRGAAGPAQPSSRQIPLGKYLELTSRSERGTIVWQAEVIRNDEIELVVAPRMPLWSRPGDEWVARYYCGMSAWEFPTSTVWCDGQRLILTHSEDLRFTNRRRFARVPLRTPALLARLPFVQRDGTPRETAADTDRGAVLQASIRLVESVVTEFAGPGLRLETRLPVQVDDRVLVLWRLPAGRGGPATGAEQPEPGRILTALGRVRRGQDIERGVGIPDAIDRVWEGAAPRDPEALAAHPLAIAVELTGLSNEEIDKLALIVSELSCAGQDVAGDRAAGPPQELVKAN